MADIWYVRRLYVNSQGYANNGNSYFGVGAPLYEAMSDREYLNFRALSRQGAIEKLQASAAWRFGDNPKLAHMESDRIKPFGQGAANRMFYTKAGYLTRYALTCGYVEIRGDSESGVRLEQVSSNGTLRVYGTGRWIRGEGESYHTTLKSARAAFIAFDHAALSLKIKRESR